MPLFDLPAPPAYTMSNAPLVQALAQVRYPLIADFESMQGIAPLQRLLRDSFPFMEQERVQEVSLVSGPAGPSASTAASINWKFSNDVGSLIIVGAGSATLSIGEEYSGVHAASELFALLLNSLADVGVARCDRLGVRYLSIATDQLAGPNAWESWFREELLGWPVANIVGELTTLLTVSQAQLACVEEGLPGALQGAVRHGAIPVGTGVPGVPPITTDTAGYFLDIDIFTEGAQKFSPQTLADQFLMFHGEIDKFFYWSLTPAGGEHFGLDLHRD